MLNKSVRQVPVQDYNNGLEHPHILYIKKSHCLLKVAMYSAQLKKNGEGDHILVSLLFPHYLKIGPRHFFFIYMLMACSNCLAS